MKAKCVFMILISLVILYTPRMQANEKNSGRNTEWKNKLKGNHLKSVTTNGSNEKRHPES